MSIRVTPVAMVFLARGLEVMQNHFKTKIFRRNYATYRFQIKMRRDDLVWRGIPRDLQTDEQQYLLACFNKRKFYEFILWDLCTFESFRLETDKTPFVKF